MSRPERVLSIAHVLAGAGFGGLESVVQMLCRGLVSRGHTVDVVPVLDGEGPAPLVDALRATGARVHPLPVGGRAYMTERRLLGRLLGDLTPQVVHTHGYRADFQAGAVAGRLGLPRISTLHGFTGGGAKLAIYEWLQLRSLRRYERLIAVSAPIEARLAGAGIAPGRIERVQNAYAPAVDVESRPAAREALGLPGDAPVVGWVGRLSREKGPDVLVSAIERLATPDARVCFVGEGPEREGLDRALAAKGLADRVVFAGVRPDASRLFSAFDAFALSSRTEGTPIVLFEAMAAGVPIVATGVGGVPDVLDERCAELVASDDPGALAGAIDRSLAGGAAVRARVEAADRRLRERFGIEPWLARHEEIYAHVASSGAAS